MASSTAAAATQTTIAEKLQQSPPPDPLPVGWILRRSGRHAGSFYYYHVDTGIAQWEPPASVAKSSSRRRSLEEEAAAAAAVAEAVQEATRTSDTVASAATSNKRPLEDPDKNNETKALDAASSSSDAATAAASNKRSKTSSSNAPSQVRVLHILKKHKGSRRPASWRNPKITATLEESKAELEGLVEILHESTTPEELQATFMELARTESDCSSAKRGGDLGFFGRKKMQPPFEDASFALSVGELSGIVETSSGVHVLLRIG